MIGKGAAAAGLILVVKAQVSTGEFPLVTIRLLPLPQPVETMAAETVSDLVTFPPALSYLYQLTG
jgi:hypothetical protein